jgi:pyruvate kinase
MGHTFQSRTEILKELKKVKKILLDKEKAFDYLFEDIHPDHLINSKNLIHYLTLRTMDIKSLQNGLHTFGLSSLSISESHIMGQINAILQILTRRKIEEDSVCTYEYARQSVNQKINALFGPKVSKKYRHIMVTMDSKWLENTEKFEALLNAGMNIARINCAHDNTESWQKFIDNIRKASETTGIPCKIYMDLAGPKIRTVLKKKEAITIEKGEKICLTSKSKWKASASKYRVVGCSIKKLAGQLKPGEKVYFDDGLIKSEVIESKGDLAILEIQSIASEKPRLKHEKGINFPDSTLQFPSLTKYDKECLPFISEHADMVGYSFVKDKSDIQLLRENFHELKRPPIIIKIENVQAVYNLPSLLFECMKDELAGVMIARGDLAIEIGFEKLSEIQEEILWICEAAHVPVIWATQVLENLNKTGLATRSEITDAARSSGADCVMLNKGKNIVKTVKTLQNIFGRMGNHQYKKRFVFRPLTIATKFINDPELIDQNKNDLD